MRPLNLAHDLITSSLTEGDIAIDATCGNGHDTVFLARHANHVYAFDIQPAAIESTRARLAKHNLTHKVTLINTCHSAINISTPVKVAMFNLGYLPGSDKSVITTPDTTITALNACYDLLQPGGLITIMVYPRHDGGRSEANAVLTWARNHNATVHGDENGVMPFLVCIHK